MSEWIAGAWPRILATPLAVLLIMIGQSGPVTAGPTVADGPLPTSASATGQVLAWGHNGYGQTSVPVEAQSGVTAIAAKGSHSLALRGGKVLAWGRNDSGQTSVPVEAQSGVTAIAAGSAHSLALKDGRVLAWGRNDSGQTSVPVEAQSGVTAIAAGGMFSMALKDGRVLAWGSNDYGQTSVPVEARSGVTAIAAGFGHSLALEDGKVLAWGRSHESQWPVPVEAQSTVTAIAAGHHKTLALKDGQVLVWGESTLEQALVPVEAQSGVSAIADGVKHALALKDGQVLAWGDNGAGQTSVPVDAGSRVTAVAAGGYHSLALRVATAPSAPSAASATAGDARATVIWEAPASDGGAPVTGYTVTSSPDSRTCTTTGARACVVTGLANGTPYTFTVTATNTAGTSVASVASDPVTPIRVLPTTVAGGITTADGVPFAGVPWSVSDDAGVIQSGTTNSSGGFTYEADPTSDTVVTFGATGSGVVRGSVTVPAGQSHLDIVTAATHRATVQVVDKFGAPLPYAKVTTSGALAAAQWTVPGYPGLMVHGPLSPAPGMPWTDSQGRIEIVTVGDLPSGDVATATVRTEVGSSGGESTRTVRLSDFVGSAEHRQARVTASAAPIMENARLAGDAPGPVPSGFGQPTPEPQVIVRSPEGAPIAGVPVEMLRVLDGDTPESPRTEELDEGGYVLTGSDGKATITGLTEPGRYRVVNRQPLNGVTARSVNFLVAFAPSAPRAVSAEPGDGRATVSWKAPASDGRSPITGYAVTSAPGAKTCTSVGTSCVVPGLDNGREYTFTVTATNAAGISVASAATAAVTPSAPAPLPPAPSPPVPSTAPSVAVKVRATSGGSKLFVDVNPNMGKGHWTFKVQRQSPNGSWNSKKSYRTQGSSETRTVNLPKGTYRVVVRAKYGYAETSSATVHLKR